MNIRTAARWFFCAPPGRPWWWPVPRAWDALHALSALASLAAFALYAFRPRFDCPATSGLYFAATAIVSGARDPEQPFYGVDLACGIVGAAALSACPGMEAWMRLIGWATVGVHLCCAVPRFRRRSAATEESARISLLEVYDELSDRTEEEGCEEEEQGRCEEGESESESESAV